MRGIFGALSPNSIGWDRAIEAQHARVDDAQLAPELGSEKPSMSGLPQAASAKLRRWRVADDEARVLLGDVFDQHQALQAEKQRVTAMIRQQQTQHGVGDDH